MSELQGKRLLVLGGSDWIDIIKDYAKKSGITLIGTGNNPNSPISHLDEYYPCDSTDHDAMKALIKEKKIDGVYLGGNEKVIKHACRYVNELGMPCYCNPTQWDLLQNKGSFKELCKKFGLPVAERFNYTPGMHDGVKFPAIVKPEDACASVGITICNSYEELDKAYGFALENSPSGNVIVEECVNNSGMDVFFQITDKKIEFCLLGDKYPVQLAEGAGSVAGARVLPSLYTKEFRKRFEEKIINMFSSVGLYQGLIWMEIFHDGDNYYFNEVGYRPNGSLSIVGIDYLCGINTVAADIYYALTGHGKKDGFPSLILKSSTCQKSSACEYWIALKHGVVGSVDGLDKLLENKNILALFPKYGVGSEIPHTNGFAQNFCVVHFGFDDAKELGDVIQAIKDTVQVCDKDGNDMIIHKDEKFVKNLLECNS